MSHRDDEYNLSPSQFQANLADLQQVAAQGVHDLTDVDNLGHTQMEFLQDDEADAPSEGNEQSNRNPHSDLISGNVKKGKSNNKNKVILTENNKEDDDEEELSDNLLKLKEIMDARSPDFAGLAMNLAINS